MTRILEVSIAIILLFFFIFFAIELYSEDNNQTGIYFDKYSELLKIKAEQNEFRQLIEDGNLDRIYNNLEPNINTDFGIELCTYIDENCKQKNLKYTNQDIKAESYYLIDINKTINLAIYK